MVVALLAVGAAVTIAPIPLSNATPVAEAAPTERFVATPGPLGPITVIGDSVLLGSLLTSPTLAGAHPDRPPTAARQRVTRWRALPAH